MANRLQLKRGNGAPGSIFYAGEPMYDESGKVLYIGDNGGTGTGAGSSIASNVTYETVLEMLSQASNASAGVIKFYEDTDNGSNLVTLSGPAALSADYTITLPTAGPASADQIIKTDASGNLSFVNFLSIDADYGTSDAIIPADTITFAGTANEIQTIVTDGQIQIGLTTDVVISGNFSSTGITTLASAGGITTTGGNFFVEGDARVKGVLTVGDTTFGSDIDTRNLNVTGIATIAQNLDVNGGADIFGLTELDDVNVSGAATITGALDVNGGADIFGLVELDDVNVSGAATITGALDVNGGASIDNIQIGVTANNEIDTSTGDLTLDSAGGTVIVDDQLSVTGIATFTGDIDAQGNVTIGDAFADTLLINAGIGATVLPSVDAQHDLGGPSNRWKTVYAENFSGNFSGTADNARQVAVASTASNSTFYLTFVDSDNDPSSFEYLYTDAGVTYNASTNLLTAGNATITNDLTVTGNLRVVGTAVTFETETVKVEDRLIELGLVSGAAPTATTTWDSGVAFNYFQTSAKKSGVVWLNNQFMAMLSELSDGGGTDNDSPQITATAYAPVAAGGLYIGGIASGNEVINSSQEAVNLVFDGGTY